MIDENSTLPILEAGTFGTHIKVSPAGSFAFFGTTPCDGAYATYDEALTVFKEWFKTLCIDDQRKYAPALRSDVFAYVIGNQDGQRPGTATN